MIKKILFLFILIFLLSCNKTEILEPKIIARYYVRDEINSPLVTGCEDFEIKDFLEKEDYSCNFKVGNDIFDVIRRFRFNSKKQIIEVCFYKSEGAYCLERDVFLQDTLLCNLESLNDYAFKIDLEHHIIIEKNDTLKVDKINDKYKLIFALEGKRNDTKVIFQYE